MKPPLDSAKVKTEFVLVDTFMTEIDANLAKSALDAAGIFCLMHRDDCGGLRPALTFTGGIQLLVPSPEATLAANILAKRNSPFIVHTKTGERHIR